MNELKLVCVFCGGKAKIVGRCATAKVTCVDCNMSASPELYEDQIKNWKEEVCGEDLKSS